MDLKQVNFWIFSLVSGGYATYTDIKYKLTVWDVLDLIEIMIVKQSNENILLDNAQQIKQ